MQLESNAKICKKVIGYDTQKKFKNVITPFVVKIVFQNVGLAWIVE